MLVDMLTYDHIDRARRRYRSFLPVCSWVLCTALVAAFSLSTPLVAQTPPSSQPYQLGPAQAKPTEDAESLDRLNSRREGSPETRLQGVINTPGDDKPAAPAGSDGNEGLATWQVAIMSGLAGFAACFLFLFIFSLVRGDMPRFEGGWGGFGGASGGWQLSPPLAYLLAGLTLSVLLTVLAIWCVKAQSSNFSFRDRAAGRAGTSGSGRSGAPLFHQGPDVRDAEGRSPASGLAHPP